MRPLISLLFFLFIFDGLYAQKQKDSDLLKIFGYTFFIRNPSFLYEGIDSGTVNVIKRYLSGDRLKGYNPIKPQEKSEVLTLSKVERNSLDSQLNVSVGYKWRKSIIENYGIFNLQIVGEDIFNKRHKIQKTIYLIMQPMFIRDSTICFTNYYIYCPGLCGIGEILIHRKIKDKWAPWISVARFDK